MSPVSVTLTAWTEDQQLVTTRECVCVSEVTRGLCKIYPNRAPHSASSGSESSMWSLFTVSEVESLSFFTAHHGQVHSPSEREIWSDASSRVTSPGATQTCRNDRQVKATLMSWVHRKLTLGALLTSVSVQAGPRQNIDIILPHGWKTLRFACKWWQVSDEITA